MSKDGQARVLSANEFAYLLEQIEQHRHAEKNALIMQISFKLGLRVQEITLLRIREVAELDPSLPHGYRVKDTLVLPKSFTKGARATKAKNQEPIRRGVRFSLKEFDMIVKQIVKLAESGSQINPEDFYPELKKAGGQSRTLPLEDKALIMAIQRYLNHRLGKNEILKPNGPLIVSQKGGAYSPNTLQDHMSFMLKGWAKIERASSHSGRRTLATTLLHDEREPLKTVQKILGHKNATTTAIYHDVQEEEVRRVLKNAGKKLSK